MKYRVIKPFRDFDGSVRRAGETAEFDAGRAAKLRSVGLLGGVVPEAEPQKVEQVERDEKPETATKGKPTQKGKPPVETSTRRPSENTALR